ncbi:biotin--[acetyl-CoA-carboxylase] ligase [Erysipelothrix sp. strain 2 (EsS2-6-Brazil)]|uniref:biotin--[acetyl-CoA-carboxylase] ligase n=1 Tax=Erysipelothrix sp. strain 2 (EsS2-6-Brazil) TaxID=2500549 RepID=UPI001376E71C|nr:biotin--[acetyl-CoA-carboxylase] ligase [Erysipelothrix sp. strain 2 (EsS2-6-Brazil)]MBK2401616.1 biotin--[acetyl-CoA-carboxylase] ligase [Erysipelothrix sp. strain 2 (EsS2-6-Brazil)]NBA00769.1 biotin--[acetyl-CoA-carboxylase] ligase [Erysipelothrix rhusiopathiae]
MKTKTVLDLLIENQHSFISGEQIGDMLHMTRANVWKEVDKLRKKGYTIHSVRNKGYQYVHNANNLSSAAIRTHLNHSFIRDIHCYDSTPSTNALAKEMIPEGFKEPFLIATDHQSEGRGRRGRSFYSPSKNGIYMSLAFVPTLTLEDTQLITIIAALAVKEALSTLYHLHVDIKWLNDIYVHGKKLAGILTEGEIILESNQYRYLILGIGLNVFHDPNLPADLNEIYTSLDQYVNTDIDRNKLIATITDCFFSLYADFPQNRQTIIDDYRASCFIINHYIYINQDLSERFWVKDIDEKGQLIVCDESQNIRTLNSGEVSIQGETYYER